MQPPAAPAPAPSILGALGLPPSYISAIARGDERAAFFSVRFLSCEADGAAAALRDLASQLRRLDAVVRRASAEGADPRLTPLLPMAQSLADALRGSARVARDDFEKALRGLQQCAEILGACARANDIVGADLSSCAREEDLAVRRELQRRAESRKALARCERVLCERIDALLFRPDEVDVYALDPVAAVAGVAQGAGPKGPAGGEGHEGHEGHEGRAEEKGPKAPKEQTRTQPQPQPHNPNQKQNQNQPQTPFACSRAVSSTQYNEMHTDDGSGPAQHSSSAEDPAPKRKLEGSLLGALREPKKRRQLQERSLSDGNSQEATATG